MNKHTKVLITIIFLLPFLLFAVDGPLVNAIAWDSDGNPDGKGRLIAVGAQGGIDVSTNLGKTWTNASPLDIYHGEFDSIATDNYGAEVAVGDRTKVFFRAPRNSKFIEDKINGMANGMRVYKVVYGVVDLEKYDPKKKPDEQKHDIKNYFITIADNLATPGNTAIYKAEYHDDTHLLGQWVKTGGQYGKIIDISYANGHFIILNKDLETYYSDDTVSWHKINKYLSCKNNSNNIQLIGGYNTLYIVCDNDYNGSSLYIYDIKNHEWVDGSSEITRLHGKLHVVVARGYASIDREENDHDILYISNFDFTMGTVLLAYAHDNDDAAFYSHTHIKKASEYDAFSFLALKQFHASRASYFGIASKTQIDDGRGARSNKLFYISDKKHIAVVNSDTGEVEYRDSI